MQFLVPFLTKTFFITFYIRHFYEGHMRNTFSFLFLPWSFVLEDHLQMDSTFLFHPTFRSHLSIPYYSIFLYYILYFYTSFYTIFHPFCCLQSIILAEVTLILIICMMLLTFCTTFVISGEGVYRIFSLYFFKYLRFNFLFSKKFNSIHHLEDV